MSAERSLLTTQQDLEACSQQLKVGLTTDDAFCTQCSDAYFCSVVEYRRDHLQKNCHALQKADHTFVVTYKGRPWLSLLHLAGINIQRRPSPGQGRRVRAAGAEPGQRAAVGEAHHVRAAAENAGAAR